MICETVGCLPNAGGLFDQVPGHIWRLTQVYRARDKQQTDKADIKSGKRKSDTDGPKVNRH